ncbi:stage II sporulation protein E [Paenibacillus sp. N1-5-1-14]|uniref:stage II sporulation protein E n=1 Tax=Paenibacillus radicibacter TaxID=2972488 RepID=UPI002159B590|nr:stage II sporulation protein E [Paenibacillus radicibacter]MCR8645854.1 stage II sporulation protein E [Paenibacillus radicibacter]
MYKNVLSRIQGGLYTIAIGNRFIQAVVARKWSIFLLLIGFLLGRAMILDELAPFALAYFAVIYFQRKELVPWVIVSLFCGGLVSAHPNVGQFVIGIGVFLLIQKAIEKYGRSNVSMAPFIVFGIMFMVKLFFQLVATELSWYAMMLIGVEALLSGVLTYIFIQALPVFTLTRRNYQLRHEEIICLIILLASVMTGAVGWSVGPVMIQNVESRYLILLFAMVGGAPFGASVGVVSGLILSLADSNAIYQMSLLAFAGLLAGLLKDGRRVTVSLGLLIGSSILSFYLGSAVSIINSTWESLIAIGLFLLTPKSVLQTLAKYVPGTQENMKGQQDYAKRVRDVTAGRVEQFSEVFRQLATSFKQLTGESPLQQKEHDVEHFMNAVTSQTCKSCFKRERCWDQNFLKTYSYMTDMMTEIEVRGQMDKRDIRREWKNICSRTDSVLQVMKEQYGYYQHDIHWRKQLTESRALVAEQLTGVSQVMEDLAKEIKREGQELFLQEEQIREALEDLGMSIHSVNIVSLDEGKVEIEMIHQYTRGFDECRKIIAPLLSEIVGENIAVKSEEQLEREGYASVLFGSAKEYNVETGIAAIGKGGSYLSGDSYSTVELGNGKYAVALSDGMGNGERARRESETALGMLQQFLQSGMDEKLAIKSVNSVLLLRSPEEMYATVDMALIDLYSADTTFMKIGSTPSFIKRGREVIPIMASNLPVGIIKDIEVDLVSMKLQDGDYLVLMTDGILDAPEHIVNKEMWMQRMVSELDALTTQDMADTLLDQVLRHAGSMQDDMMVVVARIEKRQPEWATFRWPGMARIERPKVVS